AVKAFTAPRLSNPSGTNKRSSAAACPSLLAADLLPLRLKQWEAADGGEADGCLAMETAERRREKVEKRGSQDPEADPEQDPAAFF
ncbi:hypothetical protein KUCAC02_011450, partial [Chaenocephalus aceratus]